MSARVAPLLPWPTTLTARSAPSHSHSYSSYSPVSPEPAACLSARFGILPCTLPSSSPSLAQRKLKLDRLRRRGKAPPKEGAGKRSGKKKGG
jgi:hypothetical protein